MKEEKCSEEKFKSSKNRDLQISFFIFKIDKPLYYCYTLSMRHSEKRELKRKIARVGLFLLIVFLPAMVLAIVLAYAGVKQWVNIMILVIVMFILFGIYMWIYQKLDNRKEERMSKKKDQFSE